MGKVRFSPAEVPNSLQSLLKGLCDPRTVWRVVALEGIQHQGVDVQATSFGANISTLRRVTGWKFPSRTFRTELPEEGGRDDSLLVIFATLV